MAHTTGSALPDKSSSSDGGCPGSNISTPNGEVQNLALCGVSNGSAKPIA
eukprot:m.334665 g.334665  ORF g.334665 m.334665 type:complete len:50 (+) comp55674_c0_seq3:3-152(+)